ncbi:MAG: hypothetical protein NDF55_00265 [archaeon GB-1867-005]|nr:hypothetical protein [Candidatus Culexmicrobium cathedralense]
MNVMGKDTFNKLTEMDSFYPWYFEYKTINTYAGSLRLILGIHPGYINASKLVQGSLYLYTIVLGKVSENISLPIVTGFTIEIIDVTCNDVYFIIECPTNYWWNMDDHILLKIYLIKSENPPKEHILPITIKFKIYALMPIGYLPIQTIQHTIHLKINE